MGDRFYQQQKEHTSTESKTDVALELGIKGLTALTWEDLSWLYRNWEAVQRREFDMSGSKAQVVSRISAELPQINWSACTLTTLQEVFF